MITWQVKSTLKNFNAELKWDEHSTFAHDPCIDITSAFNG
jgi:hypothetical protein